MLVLDTTLITVVLTICLRFMCPCGLQALLNICSKYGFENYILYNPIKSICMVVKPYGYHLKCPNVYLNINKLEYIEKAKYLCVMI